MVPENIYLEVIKNKIKEAFPYREVSVWAEESISFPGDYDIVAKVDNHGVRMMYMAEVGGADVEYIADIFIGTFKDIMDDEENE